MDKPDKESYIEMDFNYGILSKTLMKDKSIDIKAKAIYALLCTYAGSSRTAFPGVALILSDLGISKDTYYKHMGQLKDHGYVRVRQENRGGGQFASNIYTLSPCPNFSDTVNSYTEKPDTEFSDTNNNNTKINSIKNNKRSKKPLPAFSTQLSKRLFNWITKNYPNRSHDDKDCLKWAEDIEKINRIDGKSIEEITKVIDWSQKHYFWHKNIKSGKKLRIKFDDLLDAMEDEKKLGLNGKPLTPYVQVGGVARKQPPIEDKRASVDSDGIKKFQEMRSRLLKKQSP